MADDITSMGSSPIYFPLVPNWESAPKLNVGIVRDFVSFPGSAHLMSTTTDLKPNEFTLTFLISDKTTENDFLTWVHQVKGKSKRFWIEHPASQFDLKSGVNIGASSLPCVANGFEKIGQDNERIYIAMKSGDLIVRKVTDSSYDDLLDELTLVLDSPTDRAIDPDDYWLIGRFLLCRLGEDGISMQYMSRDVSQFQLKFTELPAEYDDEEAS